VLSEVSTRLNRVFKHPLDGTLLGRTRQELTAGHRLLFRLEFAVVLFDLFEFD
jgi:hypothetical protein